MNRTTLALIGAVGVLGIGTAGVSASPGDERVSAYLEAHRLDALLEVQLFDRLQEEKDASERSAIARRLGGIYVEALGREGLSEGERTTVLAKGRVLVGMMPADEMLDLRVELLIGLYKEHEQAADLDRVGLLDDTARNEALEVMGFVESELTRIGTLADAQVEQKVRELNRVPDGKIRAYEQDLSELRALRSRTHFFHGWSGYSTAVLSRRRIGPDVFRAFGWVLGFEGNLPALDTMDMDLLEYDHVSRAMLGVALCKLGNGDFGEARVWLMAVEDSASAPESAVSFARQRLLEVSLAERDWVAGLRRAEELRAAEPESLLGVAQARLLVLRTLGTMDERDRGMGGREGAMTLAEMGLDRLIELGEIGHVLELHQRFGSLPMVETGFVSLYTLGLEAMGDGGAGYEAAAEKFDAALNAPDAGRFAEHAGDAALKLAQCELRLDHPGRAVEVLRTHEALLIEEPRREEAAWMMIVAHDQAVRNGQDQMGDALTALIAEYLAVYPLSERANMLIVQYALTPYMGSEDAYGALVIEDPSNPMAIRARRKLVQLLFKNPELVDGGGTGGNRLHAVIRKHAEWIWANETREASGLNELRERLNVVRIVLATGLWLDDADLGFLEGVVDRGDRLIDSEASLSSARSEMAYRRVQVLLLRGEIDRAGEIAIGDTLDESVRESALLMVYEQANTRFVMSPGGTGYAQAVVRYGRGVLDAAGPGEGMDRRLSLIAEGMAYAAESLAVSTKDESMREYAWALSLRVFKEGTPSESGLVRTAELGERFGDLDVAVECWLRLVGKLSGTDIFWHRARFESLRLLMMIDPEQAWSVYRQYVLLYPDGSPEPFGSQIRALFASEQGGVP